MTSLISYDQVTPLVDEGKALQVVHDLRQHSPGEAAAHSLDRYTLCWLKNWLDWLSPESGGELSYTQLGPITRRVPQGSVLQCWD